MLNYLTFSSPSTFTLNVVDNAKYWDGTLYYSTDTTTWNEWSGTTTLSSSSSGTTKYLYLRGSGNTYITGSSASDTIAKWVLTGTNISCNGNIENLLDYQTVANGQHPTMASYCYNSMFSGCTSLTTAPSLPATTMASYCYRSMFSGCSSLTTAPSLPATTLSFRCYFFMFFRCSKIKLSATQTEEYTQEYRIPTSGSGTTSIESLYNMFYGTGGTFTGTPSINTTYYLSNTNTIIPAVQPEPSPSETKNIWANTNQIAKAFLGSSKVSKIYLGSTLIYGSSTEPEPQPVAEPYLTFSSQDTFTLSLGNNYKMWDGTLEYSIDTINWDTWSGSSAISSSSNGTTKYLYLRGTNNTIISGQGAEYGYGNWILTGTDIRCDGNIENLLDYQTVANGNHPTMGDSCFKHMFKNQLALISTPSLPAIILSNFCYGYMFTLCSNIITIPELPATTLATWCYYSMFSNCSKIKLSTTQTEEYTQLYRLPTSGTGTIADYALGSMFVNTSGTFTEDPTINTTYYLSNTNTIVE